MSPKAGESNLLRQNDVYRVLRLFLVSAVSLPQQVFPLLPNKLVVLGVCQPRFTAAKEHDARGAQDDQAGEQGQYAEADELTLGDEDAGGVDSLLQGDLEQVSLGRPEEPVEGVSRKGVMLRGQRQRLVVRGPGADGLRPGLGSVLQ